MHTDGLCALYDPSSSGSTAGAIQISKSVGMGGVNIPKDVQTIQESLNRIPIDQGGAQPPLKLDGIAGPKTNAAIQKFQIKHFGWSGADGRVDPGRQTLAKINEILDANAPMPGNAIYEPMARHLAESLIWIRAAQTNLSMASAVVDQPVGATDGGLFTFSRESRMALSNRHFGIDDQPAEQRAAELQWAAAVFRKMQMVFERPGGLWGVHVFDSDSAPDKSRLAYTYSGGFYQPGERDGIVRKDAIYANPAAFETFERPNIGGPFAIVHELAHFVGDMQGVNEIVDHSYGSPDHMKARLTSRQKLRNAECYANFAWEARHGRAPKGLNPKKCAL